MKADVFGHDNKWMRMPCPKCGQYMKFVKSNSFWGVELDNRRIVIPGMYMLMRTCPNPMCEWNDLRDYNDFS